MKVLAILDNFDLQQTLIDSLTSAGVDTQSIIPCTYKDAGLFIKDTSFGLVLVDVMQNNVNSSLQFIDIIKTNNPLSKIIPIIHEKDSDLILQLIKRGIADVAITPLVQEELVQIVKKCSVDTLLSAPVNTPFSGAKGKIIAVTSYKGGTGVSTIASNLGFGLAELDATGKKVVVLDLANQSNHCAMLLDAQPTLNINQICKAVNKMESAYIFSSTSFISPNLGIIGTDPGLEGVEQLDPAILGKALDLLTESFEYVIVDLPTHTFDGRFLGTIDKADQILLITTIDITSIRDTRLYLTMLKSLGADQSKIRLLVNRYDCESGMFKTKDLEQALQNPISFYIPNDFKVCSESSQAGESIFEYKPNSMLAEALAEVAVGINGGTLFIPPKATTNKKAAAIPGLSSILSGLKK
ncbi:MAG: AAA family ATPase [Candidatus Caenarcaniphilales bacterium]|nr:AAA family ATPase [Candidatus Caenarcaniphilales bacterium]